MHESSLDVSALTVVEASGFSYFSTPFFPNFARRDSKWFHSRGKVVESTFQNSAHPLVPGSQIGHFWPIFRNVDLLDFFLHFG